MENRGESYAVDSRLVAVPNMRFFYIRDDFRALQTIS